VALPMLPGQTERMTLRSHARLLVMSLLLITMAGCSRTSSGDDASSGQSDPLGSRSTPSGDTYVPDQGGPAPSVRPTTWIRPSCRPTSSDTTDGASGPNLTVSDSVVAFPWDGVTHPMKWDADYQVFLKKIDAARAAGEPAPTGRTFDTVKALGSYLTTVRDSSVAPQLDEESADFDRLLATALLDGISANYLYDGLAERRLNVAPGPGERWTKGRQQVLALDDPWVGRFEVIVLLPEGPGPHPAIVVHPGHFEDARSHRDQRFSKDIVDAGIAMAILTPRSNDSHPTENNLSLELLKRGTSLLSVRLYELWLIRKLMRCRTDIDPKRIGLLGHSGGAVVSNMAIRIDSDWAAYVSDLTGDYLNWDGERGTVMDETAPAAHPYWNYVNDFDTAPVPMVMLPYEYDDGRKMVAFLKEKLTLTP
jgi:hypothetical protein